MKPILQPHLPYTPWADPALKRLPGIQPIAANEWLQIDDAYALQLAEKARLIKQRSQEVMMLAPAALMAAQELLEQVIAELIKVHGFHISGDVVARHNTQAVVIDTDHPLLTLSQLVQEDFCILQKRGSEHVLTGALLCFPSSWTLSEKFMQPLGHIHAPVAQYTDDMGKRVQRLFDHVKVGHPLWRANALFYDDPTLYQPHSERAPRVQVSAQAQYIRSERQGILRLPKSEAVVFSIHTYQLLRDSLTADQAGSLANVSVS